MRTGKEVGCMILGSGVSTLHIVEYLIL